MSDNDDFYVGYGKAPPGFARFVGVISFLFVIAATAFAIGWAATQDDTGPGKWLTNESIELEGRLVFAPYPMLKVTETDGSIETILMVEIDKKGVDERASAFRDQVVRIRGVEIFREPRRMVSLKPGPEGMMAVDAGAAARPTTPPFEALGNFTLSGEILDSKCYLGVMNPGHGKAHKACATLCLLGDIPPMFLIKHTDNSQSAYLVTAQDGGAIKDEIIPYVADPVEVSGEVGWQDDMPVFRIDPASIRRLAGRTNAIDLSQSRKPDEVAFAGCHHDADGAS